MRTLFPLIAGLIAASGCGSKTVAMMDAGSPDLTAPPMVTEHGVMLDYQSLMPVAGLTVTDGAASAMTDAQGMWTMTVPAGALAPVVTGPSYSQDIFPSSTSAASDVDFGPQVIPTAAAYNLEQILLSSDNTKALVHLVALPSTTCTDPSGGTVNVLSPAGAMVAYFAASNIPDPALTATQTVMAPRPLAVIYNVTPGADVTFEFHHPTCTQVPYPTTFNGKVLSGKVPTKAAEPDHVNSALALLLK
jgi:hypothetical protein